MAPWLGERVADGARSVIAGLGPYLPVLARQVADNMRSAGVYSDVALRDYFAGLGEHFAGALQVLRCAARERQSPSPTFMRMVHERIGLDASADLLRECVGQGRGAIVLSPHINNYFMNVARLNTDVPLTAYMRWVKDARRQAVKDMWYQVSGAEFISEPPDAGGPLGRIKRMSEVVRSGRPLVVLLDLTQKREEGVPVRFFGREVYLPAGVALVAVRTESPVFVMTARRDAGRQIVHVHGPFHADRAIGDRQAMVRRLLQIFADHLQAMLAQEPGLWYLWGDKRWTRTFRGDPRYVKVATEPVVACGHDEQVRIET